jgi:hypothetical protein
MVANTKENKILRKADKDPVTALVLLLNQYHGLSMRYFPSEEQRASMQKLTLDEICRVKHRTPPTIECRVDQWINDADLWRSDIDSIHSI